VNKDNEQLKALNAVLREVLKQHHHGGGFTKMRRSIETSEDLVNVLTAFLEEDDPETPEEIDAALREAGYDPEEIGAKMKTVAERALLDMLEQLRDSEGDKPNDD